MTGNSISKTFISKAVHSPISFDSDTSLLAEQLTTAVKENGILSSDDDSKFLGLFLATTYSNLKIRNNSYKKYLAKGLRVMNPADAPKGLISYVGGQLSIALNIRGMQGTLSSCSSQGFDALVQALCFLARSDNNKAIIIECIEEFAGAFNMTIPRCLVLTLENIRLDKIEKGKIQVKTLESCFEAKGSCCGLDRAVTKALDNSNLSICDVDCFFSSNQPGSLGRKIEEKMLSGFSNFDISKKKFIESDFQFSSLGLLPLVNFLNKNDSSNALKKEKNIAMFINLGEDTNSSCLIVEKNIIGGADD
jgi:beta-ketoacyl synthase-like protein